MPHFFPVGLLYVDVRIILIIKMLLFGCFGSFDIGQFYPKNVDRATQKLLGS